MYVQKNSDVEIDIDFTDPNGKDVWKKFVLSMDSWKYYADNADKDKFGLIASANEGGPHVAFAIKECELGLIEVSYVMSYENFGELILCVRLFTCTLFSAILYYHNLIVRCYDLHEWLTDTGLALVWIDNKVENTREIECTTVLNKGIAPRKTKPGRPERLMAYWDEAASVPNVTLLKKRLFEGEKAVLHICLTPHNEFTKGSENKFKLLGVRVY